MFISTGARLLSDTTKLQSFTYLMSNKLHRYQNTSLLSRSLADWRKVWLRCRSVREHVRLSCSDTATCVAADGLKLLHTFSLQNKLKCKRTQPRQIVRVS